MKTDAIDGTCYFVDIIDKYIKELTSEAPTTEDLDVSPTWLLKENEVEDYHNYLYASLKECLALTLAPFPEVVQSKIELKVLPKNIRYKFLDSDLN